jgi:CHAD domain-containing protein
MVKKGKRTARTHSAQSVSEAFAEILRQNFEHLPEWEVKARDWSDIEGVHQTRVTLRRMRSALGIFRGAIPREVTGGWSEEMRWAAGELGPARDLDVLISEGLGAIAGKLGLRGEEALLAIARRHREEAYRQVRAMLDSERYTRFKSEFQVWLGAAQWERADLAAKHRKRVAEPVVPFARKLLDKHERRVLDVGLHVNPDSPPEMHRLRIECKKLRYAAEFFMPLFPAMEEYIGHMKGLQDLLGVMNDVAVARRLIAQILEGVEDMEVIECAGALVGWRACQFEQIRGTFEERWEELVHAKHPWWKKPQAELAR